MNETGIGLGSFAGAWWRPALEPVVLMGSIGKQLEAIGRAIFALFDALAGLQESSPELDRLLGYKVPDELRALASPSPVLAVRPDFQLADGGTRLVATELETAPSSHGAAHALQVAYGLRPDLALAFAEWLGDRELVVALADRWRAYLPDQAAFVRALREHGARARVLEERNGPWPRCLPGDSLVFRFGYLDTFEPGALRRLVDWHEAGIPFANPPSFPLDGKSALAAMALPVVRERIAALARGALATLDAVIPETFLVAADTLARVLDERESLVLKFAGWDPGDRSWGGRSLEVGAEHDPESWARVARALVSSDWPVVAQRHVPSLSMRVPWFDQRGDVQALEGATSRLRVFLLRGSAGEAPCAAGAHVTWRGGSPAVTEDEDSVQAPAVFAE